MPGPAPVRSQFSAVFGVLGGAQDSDGWRLQRHWGCRCGGGGWWASGVFVGGGTVPATVTKGQVPGGRAYTRTCYQDPAGAALAECWIIHHGGHAWSGGVPHGSYADAHGPDASAEFIRFFGEHPGVPSAR